MVIFTLSLTNPYLIGTQEIPDPISIPSYMSFNLSDDISHAVIETLPQVLNTE